MIFLSLYEDKKKKYLKKQIKITQIQEVTDFEDFVSFFENEKKHSYQGP